MEGEQLTVARVCKHSQQEAQTLQGGADNGRTPRLSEASKWPMLYKPRNAELAS